MLGLKLVHVSKRGYWWPGTTNDVPTFPTVAVLVLGRLIWFPNTNDKIPNTTGNINQYLTTSKCYKPWTMGIILLMLLSESAPREMPSITVFVHSFWSSMSSWMGRIPSHYEMWHPTRRVIYNAIALNWYFKYKHGSLLYFDITKSTIRLILIIEASPQNILCLKTFDTLWSNSTWYFTQHHSYKCRKNEKHKRRLLSSPTSQQQNMYVKR